MLCCGHAAFPLIGVLADVVAAHLVVVLLDIFMNTRKYVAHPRKCSYSLNYANANCDRSCTVIRKVYRTIPRWAVLAGPSSVLLFLPLVGVKLCEFSLNT